MNIKRAIRVNLIATAMLTVAFALNVMMAVERQSFLFFVLACFCAFMACMNVRNYTLLKRISKTVR